MYLQQPSSSYTFSQSDNILTHEAISCVLCDYSSLTSSDIEYHTSDTHNRDFTGFHIKQIDGNISQATDTTFTSSSDDSNSSKDADESLNDISCSAVNAIPVNIGNRPSCPRVHLSIERPRVLRTLRRDNKAVQGLSLPVISNYNMRSLLPKLDYFVEDFVERDIGLSFLTEIWEKSCNVKHQNKLKEMFEMKGILYISTPRPGLKRGGGVAIAADPLRFSLSKFNVPNPHLLEVSWGLLKPKQVTGTISKIICCAFYSPPYSKKKTKLIDHLSSTLQDLLLEHPGAGVVIAGDRNDLSIERLLNIEATLRQIVRNPTHGKKVLDVVLTNIWRFYNDPIIVNPVPVDDPAKGVPSDHLGVVIKPIVNPEQPPLRRKHTFSFRPMPESKLREFGNNICHKTWDFMLPTMSSTQLAEAFQNEISGMMDEHFPIKNLTVTDSDQPWITSDLKKLKRSRQREYERHGKSVKYNNLKNSFIEKQVEAVEKYTNKVIKEVTEGNKTSSYKALRKLGVRLGDTQDDLFVLPEHSNLGLTEEESAERIADYFSMISQEYEPLNFDKLQPNIQKSIIDAKDDPNIPVIEPYEVHRKISKAKKPNSVIHGDIPKKIIQLFSPELAEPASRIFNKISSSFEYPRPWVIESQIVIPKVFPPVSEDELRPISRTFFFSKIYESFIGEWLLPIILPYMDPGQYGKKGSSIVHYLIKFLHFIHSSLDLKQPHAVLSALIDLNKAFNRVSHMHVIQDLYDMHAPGWILAILFSYLSGRSMTMSYGKSISSSRMLPGSTPQGAFLGGLIFIVKYNGACLRPNVPRPILSSTPPLSVKFVDDHSCAVKIDLKKALIKDPLIRQKPLNFHERTGHILPNNYNMLQITLDDLRQFTVDNLMRINEPKTKIMLFNTSRNFDFPPEMRLPDSASADFLNVVEVTRLLGVQVTTDLKWSEHTKFICKRANSKLWMLRRMKILRIDPDIIIDFYFKEIRSICEMACQVFHSGLTKNQSRDIESIQKRALKLILGDLYSNYEEACTIMSAEPLSDRRDSLCLTFVKRAVRGGQHKDIFTPAGGTSITRSNDNLLKEYTCNTKRFFDSPLVSLSRLYNQNLRKLQ